MEPKKLNGEKLVIQQVKILVIMGVFWNITNSLQDPIYTVQWEPP